MSNSHHNQAKRQSIVSQLAVPMRGPRRMSNVSYTPISGELAYVQSWPKKFVLSCVISPLRQQAESLNLGHTFFGQLCRCLVEPFYHFFLSLLSFINYLVIHLKVLAPARDASKLTSSTMAPTWRRRDWEWAWRPSSSPARWRDRGYWRCQRP